MKSHYIILNLLLFFVIAFPFSADAQFVINNKSDFSQATLHKNTKIINLKQQDLSVVDVIKINDSKFSSLSNQNTDLGFTNDNYWLHFKINNNSTDEVQYYLETSRPIVDFATLYKIDNSNKIIDIQKSGDNIPFKERSFNHRKTIFKINLYSKEIGNYYIHLKSDGEVINAPVILRTSENLIENTYFEQIVFGFFYGILLIASILYFFFFYAMKEKVFLIYSLYVVFIGLLQFSLDGYFYQYISPDAGWFSTKSVLIFAVISGIFLGNYAQNYLNIKNENSTLHTLFNCLYISLGCLFLTIIFIPSFFKYCYPAMNVLGLILLLLIITSLVNIYVRTKRVYVFFSLGIFFLILGFVIFILKNFSLLPYNFITENSSKLGSGVEVIFLSLSMANLIKELKEISEKAQGLALQKSEEMNELKSYFLSNISHELRTPLNTIMNLIELINGETDSDSIQKKCEIIKYSSQSLLSSVNDILDFSKIEKDEIKLEIIDFDSHQLFNEIGNNIKTRALEKNLEFEFILDSNIPKMLKGDANRIRQISNNILFNALKFTPEGKIKFDIKAIIEGETTKLELTITDTGVGISTEKMQSIFDSFSQETINNKRKYGGLGLGLYIVKALVNLHEGDISLKNNELQTGTVCNLKLNVQKADRVESIQLNVENNFDLLGKNILVVEDNAMNQMVIKMITKKWLNTLIDYVNNGQECLDKMATSKYDIILMDLQMPIMDGYEAAIEIRKGNSGINSKDIPIIAITADVMESTKIRVKEIGMNHYLSKPVSKEDLFYSIKECTI